MKSNSPFQQNSCAKAKKEFKAGYMNRTNKTKEENLAEYNREKGEFHCSKDTNFKMKLKPTDDAERPIETKKESPAKEVKFKVDLSKKQKN